MYYFINKEIKKLVIAIVYVDDVYFMSSKDSLLLLELKQKYGNTMSLEKPKSFLEYI